MKPLKAVGLAVLGFFLFMSLLAFGPAFSVNSTLLNKDFLPNELDRLDVGPLVAETVEKQSPDLAPDIRDAVVRTVTKLKPQLETQFTAANDRVYAYLFGQTEDIDLSQVLKDTILNKDFITSVENEADVLTLARQSLRNELADLIPPDPQQLAVYLDQAMPRLDPWLKQQIEAATGPVVDYLVGDSPSLHLAISLNQMKTILRASVRTAFMKSPPPQLAGASQAQLDAGFDEHYGQFAAQIPATATIDPSTLGIGPSTSMAQALSDAESGLAQARTAIGRFRLYYILLIIVVIVLALGIILIHHEVKGACRDLGIVLLTYGFLQFIGILIGGYILAGAHIRGVPPAVQLWLPGLYWDVFRPLQILSAVLTVLGVGMIILSVLYRRRPAA